MSCQFCMACNPARRPWHGCPRGARLASKASRALLAAARADHGLKPGATSLDPSPHTLAPGLGALLGLEAIGLRKLLDRLVEPLVAEPASLGDRVPLGGLNEVGTTPQPLRVAARQPVLRHDDAPLGRGTQELRALRRIGGDTLAAKQQDGIFELGVGMADG